ncbi:MAG: HAMP domain-containing histidine kinase [Clostridia bacterium]|nr:HAMP domain-containing histidine kinase [Clostridia bacterium]
MEMKIKFKSVAFKWVLNVFLVIFFIILALEVIFGLFIHSYYTTEIEAKAKEYAQSFITPLRSVQFENFEAISRDYCEKFEHKDKMEVQILSKDGKVIVSTSGFSHTPISMPDFERATATDTGSFLGKSSVGEDILAQTTLLTSKEGETFGAVRWVVSLSEANKQVLFACVIAIVIGVAILAVIVFSGMYFTNSIVRPIRSVSNVSRKIAMGDFNSRIEIEANNEVGELCDSINYMASELMQAENMKNDFISSVSHELRTPLTAIRGWAETAKLSVGYDEETVIKGLDIVLRESERLHSLVEELLDFSRMRNDKLSLNMAEFNPNDILSEAAEMYRELSKQQSVELVFLPYAREVCCYGDANRIKQVFINVIDNALKYNQAGGQILIEQKCEEGCIQVTVSDTGVGIAAQDLDRVKEKFYKANKQVRGSGIGLAVADEIIKQHNGLLLIDSTEGMGTTVRIVLPVLDKKAEGEANEL